MDTAKENLSLNSGHMSRSSTSLIANEAKEAQKKSMCSGSKHPNLCILITVLLSAYEVVTEVLVKGTLDLMPQIWAIDDSVNQLVQEENVLDGTQNILYWDIQIPKSKAHSRKSQKPPLHSLNAIPQVQQYSRCGLIKQQYSVFKTRRSEKGLKTLKNFEDSAACVQNVLLPT
ncbi:hypothetical protein J6590_066603 [Homalodisca vitripennis]|nr:hypothetical protein J6590_066603 [Homalodisca vitripennis]